MHVQQSLTKQEEVALVCFLKTSGGHRLHVVARPRITRSFEGAKDFSRALFMSLGGQPSTAF